MGAELLPTPERVGVAWLKANVPYLQENVATSLPEKDDWASVGFVTVASVGGGQGDVAGSRVSMLSLTYWGVASSSGKPPWERTAQMAEQVRQVVDPTGIAYGATRKKYLLTSLGTTYRDAKVLNVGWASEPQRRPGDQADFAVYQNDLSLHWVVI